MMFAVVSGDINLERVYKVVRCYAVRTLYSRDLVCAPH